MPKRWGIILLIMGLAGCLRGTAPPPLIFHYTVEYAPPRLEVLSRSEALLKVERFAADRLYAGQAMLYRKGPYSREAYHEERWRVSPGDMVTDFLRRDIRQAGIFRAVLSAREPEETRFLLQGGVEEFLEADEGNGPKALLVVTVTLLDLSSREISRRVLFQNTYRCEAPLPQPGGAGLAAAMSAAMSEFSARVIADIQRALRLI